MKLAGFYFCFALFSLPVAHAADIFFAIAATPTPLSDERYAAIAYKIDPDGKVIEKIRELVPAESGVSFVKSSQDGGLIVLGYPAYSPVRVAAFDTASPFAAIDLALLPPKCTDCTYLDSNLILVKQSPKLQLQLKIRSGDVREYALSLDRGATSKLWPHGVRELEERFADGVPGPAIAGDFFYLARKARSGDVEQSNDVVPSLGYALPAAFKYDEREVLVVLGSNSRYIVLTSNKNRRHGGGGGATIYYVLTRSTGEWRSIVLPGDRTDVRLFGDWIAASVATGAQATQEAEGAASSSSRITGNSIERRSAQFRLNLQKRLLVASLRTGEVTEWDVDSADSEVLLVRDAKAIYRVRDSLYERHIGSAGGVARLLIRDEKIDDIHWLFVAKHAR